MASEAQWAEQELVFLQQLKGELTYEESWGKHVDIIGRFNEEEVDLDIEDINEPATHINQHEYKLHDSDFFLEEESGEANIQLEPKTKILPTTNRFIEFSEDLDETKLPCPHCGYRAKKASALQVHVQMNHLNLHYLCKVCAYKTKEIWYLRKHIRSNHKKIAREDVESLIIWECGICKWTALRDEMNVHIAEEHPEFENYVFSRERGPADKVFKCKICNTDFSSEKFKTMNLRNHMQNVHIKAIFKCDKCSFEEVNLHFLYNHIQQTHLPDNLEKSEERECTKLYVIYKCHICDFELAESDKRQMLDHMQSTHEQEMKNSQIQCGECELVAGTRKQLSFHMMKRHPNANTGIILKYQCPLCEHGSQSSSNLRIHMHSHIGTSYLCNICSFTTKHKNNFRDHFMTEHAVMQKGSMRENTIYHCAMCDIQAGAQEYDMHMIKVHKHPVKDKKQPRKYQCPLCEHGSNLIANLSLHMHGHIRTTYCCKFCNFTSQNSIKFRAHFITTHMFEKRNKGWISQNTTYHCDICDFQADVREYESHMINSHRLPVGDRKKFISKKVNSNRRKGVKSLIPLINIPNTN